MKILLRKALTLLIMTFVFGYAYAWVSPWAFPEKKTVGFGYGMLHGAMMPIALPGLVIGKDVPIYDTDNTGRIYKIGYICGINLCGIAFFGPVFYNPRKKDAPKK